MTNNGKAAVVDFATLDDNNKTEFLEFLLKNNISFHKGAHAHDQFVAKVTIDNKGILKPTKSTPTKKVPYQNKSNPNILKPSNNNKPKATSKPVLAKMPPNKQPLKKTGSYRKENIEEKVVTPVKKTKGDPQRDIKSHTPERMQENRGRVNTMTTEFGTETQQGTHISKQVANKSDQKSMKGKSTKADPKTADKAVKVNSEVKKKTHDERQISGLVNRYLKIFDLKLNGQRPIKWPLAQVSQSVEEFYNEIFQKTTHQLVSGKRSPRGLTLVKYIREHFHHKFKSERLGNSNLINFLHSLCYHLEKGKHALQVDLKCSSLISLQTFEEFISQVYEQEDFLFYLFVRDIVKRKVRNYRDNSDTVTLMHQDIARVVHELVGKDQQLVDEYLSMIMSQVKDKNPGSQRKEGAMISSPEFLRLVVEDYRIKRTLGEQYSSIDCHSVADPRMDCILQKDQHEVNEVQPKIFREPTLGRLEFGKLEHSADELTFGEDSKERSDEGLQDYQGSHDVRQFWSCETYQDERLDINSIQFIISEKLRKKAYQLVLVVIESHGEGSDSQKGNDAKRLEFLERIILKKAMRMLNCIFEMDKMKWFEELLMEDPTDDDIETVEKLQLCYRSIKNNEDARAIGELCKNILTVAPFTDALEALLR